MPRPWLPWDDATLADDLAPEAALWCAVLVHAVRESQHAGEIGRDAREFLTTEARIGPVLDALGIDVAWWLAHLPQERMPTCW